jgi:FMN phosphatase YigB (HAD superfamily)
MIKSIIFDFWWVINKIWNLRFVLDKIKKNTDDDIEKWIQYAWESFNKSHLYEVDDLFDSIRWFYWVDISNIDICRLAVEPNLEVITLIERLSKNYKLIILTSIHKGLMSEFLEEIDISIYFENIIETCKVHISKNNISIYKKASEILWDNPSEILFIDDGRKNLNLAWTIWIQWILFSNIYQLNKDLIGLWIKY